MSKRFPNVSICTPTYNRRPFIPMIIKCFEQQNYPRDKMEWIIIDDGTDKIEDLVKDIKGVKYFKYDEKMTLGKKRNLMHEKSSGSILVYFDDDDYYPPDRVKHAVNNLLSNKKALCAGSSEMHVYYKHINKMYSFGPYGPKHATAATFAFKRELLDITKYDETASLAEEKAFLKDYTIPFIQLHPKHTILVFSHNHNTFDKKEFLKRVDGKIIKESNYTIDDFIKDKDIKEFLMNDIDKALAEYDLGTIKHKPDVIKALDTINKERAAMLKKN
jgi:glycosyltransferase involved in cell wall biosynthesis